jgi:hypothetical protein
LACLSGGALCRYAILLRIADAALILASAGLHSGSAGAARRTGLLMGEEPRILSSARNHRGLAIRKSLVGGTAPEGHLPTDGAHVVDPVSAGARDVVEAAVLEIVATHGRDSVTEARVSIGINYVYVGNIDVSIEAAIAIVPPTPPGV